MNDKAIMAGIAAGEADAMAACMKRYARLLWPIAAAVLEPAGNDQDVEECVADAFIHLWQHPEQFRSDRGSLKSYLCVVVRSRAIDRCRGLLRRRTVPLEEAVLTEGLGLQEQMLQAETRQTLLAAVNALGEPAREILIRRYYLEQKPKTIALALGLTVKQVNNSLYRSKDRLRKNLPEQKGGRV